MVTVYHLSNSRSERVIRLMEELQESCSGHVPDKDLYPNIAAYRHRIGERPAYQKGDRESAWPFKQC